MFLFYVQDLPFLALLNVLVHRHRGRRLRRLAPAVDGAGGARVIAGELLQHVPGCEDGEPPFSQELIGGGKVNRSFLVRTRRGRFVVRLNENSIRRSGPRSRSRAGAARGGGGRGHRAAGGLRGAGPLVPDHRIPRRSAVDAALLHAHARSAFARPTPAHAALVDSSASGALRSAERRASLCRHHRAQRTRRSGAHPVLVSQWRREPGAHRPAKSARRPSCTATCITATC